jgi:hypothetical protein
MKRGIAPAARLLGWCLLGTAAAQWAISLGLGKSGEFSPIFRFLLKAYDTHGNALLAAVVVAAFLLRTRPQALAMVRLAGERPWLIAAGVFPLLCLGALFVYEARPLAMDEYAPLFQAQAFAAGRASGKLPPELLDGLIPRFFQTYFFAVSRATGEVSSAYWPGFALLLTPFVWLGIPWAANPAIGALTIPAIHRVARRATGSSEAAGWAVALTLASPVFVLNSISFYAISALLLCNVVYVLLLLQPCIGRALAAGFVGSIALVLSNPVPHLLFGAVFFVWLLFRGRSLALLAALIAGYLPLALLLGVGWHVHLTELAATPSAAAAAKPAAAAARSVLDSAFSLIAGLISAPDLRLLDARLAGLSKTWTWAAGGLLVLAALGAARSRGSTPLKLIGLAFLVTLFGYVLVPFDQGHGWGYRYLHPAWFALPVFAAAWLSSLQEEERPELRAMAAWVAVLSLALANALRLAQADAFVERHVSQVPPLLAPPARGLAEVVFVDIEAGFYTRDLVQNDPFLRSPRIVMVYPGALAAEALMASRFPQYRRDEQGKWGERWIGKRTASSSPY